MSDTQLHFGLSAEPFATALDPAFFFASDGHAEALARIELLARQGGTQLGLLTGEIGSGKSLTRLVFAARSRDRRLIAQVSSSHYPFPDLMRAVLTQLGVPDPGASASEFDLTERLRTVVESRRRPVVVLLDEAQEIDRDGLVGVRALCNLADGAFDLTVVLVGQPELRQTVQALPQLDQRIGLRYHLGALAEPEVGAYVSARLGQAGHRGGDLFTAPAVAELAAVSGGVPRRINRLGRLAMTLAGHRRLAAVGPAEVRAVVDDLHRQGVGAAA